MKKITSAIGLFFLLVLALTLTGCGNSRYDVVRNGYLKAFGNQVSVGEAFEVVAGCSVKWAAKELAPAEAQHNTHYLVEAKWEGRGGDIVIQFVVKNDGSDFRLHGSIINGEYNNALTTILAIKKAYNDKN